MSFSRPSTQALVTRVAVGIASRLPGVDPTLRRQVTTALAQTLGGELNELYGYLSYIAEQPFPDTVDDANLVAIAADWGIFQKVPNAAVFTVTFTGTTGDVPIDTPLQRSDGAQFLTAADTVLSGGAGSVNVTAVVPGSAGNTANGATLNLVAPISGVNSAATVGAAVTIGNDEETLPQLRARWKFRLSQPPQGGDANDYVEWATDQPGVTRAWCLPLWLGLGTVGVTFVMDGRSNIIPLTADVNQVQAALNILRPVTANLTVFAPTPIALNPRMHLNPSNAVTQAAATAALADLISKATPGGSVDAEGVAGGTTYLSAIRGAIAAVPGLVDWTVESPVADVVMTAGQLLVLGTPVFD